MNDSRSGGPLAALMGLIALIVVVFLVIGGGAWLFSFKGVDSGEIAFVREGGPFDGRDVTEVRQPGSGPKPIGAFNHQDTLPVTERDLTDEIEQITVPSRDGVDMVVNGQALFRLTTDPKLAKEFYLKYGRRKWDGKDLSSDEGFRNFLRVRLIPILQDTLRQSIGEFDCVALKNTCVYVLNADQLADDTEAAQNEAKKVNNTQTIQKAQDDITKLLVQKFRDGLGGDYFEGVRFQNLKPDFTPEIAQRVQAAQGKRAEVAEARLEAQRQTEEAEGKTRVAREQAKQIREKANAYSNNPAQARIDQIRALCGEDGCDPQVIGGDSIITQLPKP